MVYISAFSTQAAGISAQACRRLQPQAIFQNSRFSGDNLCVFWSDDFITWAFLTGFALQNHYKERCDFHYDFAPKTAILVTVSRT